MYSFSKIPSFLKSAFLASRENNYAPKFLESKVLLYAVVLLLIVKIIAAGFFLPLPKNIFFADVTKIDLVNLLNKNRGELGLNTLVENEKLDQAARLKAQDMVNNGYFSHNSPQGVTPWHWFGQVNYKYKYAGENLAVGFVDSKNVYEAWFNSPSHKANLLNSNYREVGTAVLQGFGGNNSILVVQLFGNPALTSPAVTNAAAKKPASPAVVASAEPKEATSPVKAEEKVAVNDNEKVLAKTTQYSFLSKSGGNTQNTFYYRFLNFMIYNSDEVLKYLSYVILMLVSACLLVSIMVNAEVQRKELLLRSLLLVVLLCASAFIDRDVIYQMMPYQVII